MILVRMNHLELTTESKSKRLSIIRFCRVLAKASRRGVLCTCLAALFEEHLVVLAQRNTKDDGGNILETVNPLFAFTSLAADIEHANKAG